MNHKRIAKALMFVIVIVLIVALLAIVGPALFDALLEMHGIK